MNSAFRRFGVVTVIAVYLLILVGGIVRSTGAGMGCPDWPKCFGQWIPPTDVSELPANYKEIFKVQGKEIADFDAFKTWVEYINRLIGVLIGFFIFLTFIFSFSFFKKDPAVFYLSFLTFLLVGFQGWLGSVVVSTNLSPLMITAHMLVALVIVSLLIYVITRAWQGVLSAEKLPKRASINRILGIALFLSFVQVALGTQVREAIDHAAQQLGESMRGEWIAQAGLIFYIHRSFSLVILGVNVWLIYRLFQQTKPGSRLFFWSKVMGVLLVTEILTGVIMAYFAIPPFLQPVHLLLAALVFGVQFFLLLLVNYQWFTQADQSHKLTPQLS